MFSIAKKFFLSAIVLSLVFGTSAVVYAAKAPAVEKTITMTFPKTAEVWKKATNVDVRWNSTGFTKTNRVHVFLSKNNTPARDKADILVSKSKLAYKGIAPIAPRALEKIPYGKYYVKIAYIPKGKPAVFSVSKYEIDIQKRPAPLLTITTPIGGEKWIAGSKQKVTWTANFKKGLNKDTDTKKTYSGAKVVPTYGIDKGGNSLDLLKIPAEDRAKLLGLPKEDLYLLSRFDPDYLSLLDPIEAGKKITGLSTEGMLILSALSPNTFVHFATLNFGTLGAFNGTGGLKMLETIINPLSFATGSIFGDDDDEEEPQLLSNTIYLQKQGDTTDIKLKKSKVENAATSVSLKNIQPGTYRLHIVSKLSKKFSTDSYSGYFTIIAPEESTDAKAGFISIVLPNSSDDALFTNNNAAIRWTTSFAAKTAKITEIKLFSPTFEQTLSIVDPKDIKNDGFVLVAIPNGVAPGKDYKIRITIKDGKEILVDESDGFIEVRTGVAPVF